MIWHSSTKEDVIKQLETDPVKGLSSEQVNARFNKYGPNRLTEKKPKSFLQLFALQFKDVTIIVLLIAAVLSLITTLLIPGHSALEPIVIMLIVAVSAAAGALQQRRAEIAISALNLLSPPSAKVLRNGVVSSIPSTNIVPGDILILNKKDYIPADARLIESSMLRCNESVLTGDSIPCEKTTDCIFSDITAVGDQKNMVFSGCSVESGSGRAIVTDTGMYTEMGKMASILKEDKNTTRLQERLGEIKRVLGTAAIVVCAFIFVFGMIFTGGEDIFTRFLNMFMTSVALAVAAVPEGLAAIVTVTLAVGVKRMIKKNIIVRSLSSVESLGSTTVICTDKTGTLTHNTMTVTEIFNGSEIIKLGKGDIHPGLKNIITMGAMCCDASAEIIGGKTIRHGDPTEAAIVTAAMKYADIDKSTIENVYPRLCELPFDCERRLMTTVNMIDSKPVAVVKGAPDVIISRCTGLDSEAVLKINSKMAMSGLRVIGVAFKQLEGQPSNPTEDELEYGLTFAGLIGISDPPRSGAREAVKMCKEAGIKVIMITGDHVATAVSVAKEIGILTENDRAATGEEIESMTDQQLERAVDKFTVFARVSPVDKTRIIKAWQKRGEVVSMLGDGVNDAPSLKTADIGCTVESASDIAKGTADVILTNSSFSSMADAVTEGKGIFSNIRKTVNYLLCCNLGEVLTVFFAMLFWQSTPVIAIQLLWINMITSGLPALSIGMERPVLKNISGNSNDGIFTKSSTFLIVMNGVIFSIVSLIAFGIGGENFGGTMAFATLALSQLFASVSMRSERLLLDLREYSFNPAFIASFVGALLLIIAVLTVAPLMKIFDTVSLGGSSWICVLLLSLIPLFATEAFKLVRKMTRAKKVI